MNAVHISYHAEQPEDDPAIEAINAEAFGPGRFSRAAHRIREGGPHDPRLSFVARADGEIVGSVRQSWVMAGSVQAVLLGPLAVRPQWKNRGIGRQLVRIALEAAERHGAPAVILVGDAPYYAPLGFRPLGHPGLQMPWPVDPGRLLVAVFDTDSPAGLAGRVRHVRQASLAGNGAVSGPPDTTSPPAPAAGQQDRGSLRRVAAG
jgi:predicted N-acetyltransferase YhbS